MTDHHLGILLIALAVAAPLVMAFVSYPRGTRRGGLEAANRGKW